MANTATRKSSAKKWTILALILFLLVAIISGTYTRYTSTATGSGNVSIAQWAVSVNNEDMSNATATFDLTFTANNTDTVPNKIAPEGTATAYVDIDLTGTEVSVDFTCALASAASTNLSTVFGANYADKVTLEVGTPALQGTTSNMTLSGTTVTVGSSAMSGVVRVPITLTWDDLNTTVANTADTNTGVTQTTLTVPVELNVTQHITTAP